jgi:hypothetical protein
LPELRAFGIEEIEMGKGLLAVSGLALVAALAFSGVANANVLTGKAWNVSDSVAQNAIPGNVPLTAPDYTFSVQGDPLNLSSGPLYTVGEFIASGGGTLLTGDGTHTLEDTLFEFTGNVSVTTGMSFTAGHDDGLTLTIGGLSVISEPGPTSFVDTTRTYTGPSGTLPFQLVYGECCGAPADMAISLPLNTPGTPELSTWAMMAVGFAGLGLVGRRASRKRVLSVA